jgi:hypothetical protein
MANRYAIASRAEAAAYLDHPALGPRLRECARLVTEVEGRAIGEIFGYPDDLKSFVDDIVRSSNAGQHRLYRRIAKVFYRRFRPGDARPAPTGRPKMMRQAPASCRAAAIRKAGEGHGAAGKVVKVVQRAGNGDVCLGRGDREWRYQQVVISGIGYQLGSAVDRVALEGSFALKIRVSDAVSKVDLV